MNTTTTLPAVGDTVTVHLADPKHGWEHAINGRTGRVAYICQPPTGHSHPIEVEFDGDTAPLRFQPDEVRPVLAQSPAQRAVDALTQAIRLLDEAGASLPQINRLTRAAASDADCALMTAVNELKLATRTE